MRSTKRFAYGTPMNGGRSRPRPKLGLHGLDFDCISWMRLDFGIPHVGLRALAQKWLWGVVVVCMWACVALAAFLSVGLTRFLVSLLHSFPVLFVVVHLPAPLPPLITLPSAVDPRILPLDRERVRARASSAFAYPPD